MYSLNVPRSLQVYNGGPLLLKHYLMEFRSDTWTQYLLNEGFMQVCRAHTKCKGA